MSKWWRYLMAVMTIALVPSALMPGNATLPQPTAVLSTSNHTLRAETDDDFKNRVAQSIWDKNPEHYKCRDYPARGKVVPSDMVPTANVSATITFDPKTNGYEVITADPRIIIGHETIYKPNGVTGGTFIIDRYNWSYAEGVEPYSVYMRYVSDGESGWLSPEYRADGASQLSLSRNRDKVWIAIVATDTRTCKYRNTLPDFVWQKVGTTPRY